MWTFHIREKVPESLTLTHAALSLQVTIDRHLVCILGSDAVHVGQWSVRQCDAEVMRSDDKSGHKWVIFPDTSQDLVIFTTGVPTLTAGCKPKFIINMQ